MKKHKKNLQKIYKNNLFGNIHKNIDVLVLRYFPKYRQIAGRLPAIDRAYKKQRQTQAARFGKNAPCPLCEDIANRYVEFSTDTMLVMANDYPYYMFDGMTVNKHTMLVPRRHVSSLSQLDKKEQSEYWKLYLKLSDMGYNTMTRPTGNHRRSVQGHVHTHLIKLNDY